MAGTESEEHEFPEWLIAIANCIEEWLRQPLVMQRFREMLRRWSETRSRHRIRSVFKLSPLQARTPGQKYAALAAIHDVICKGAKSLDLWGIHRAHKDFSKQRAAIPYAVLCSWVSDITDKREDRRRLERLLEAVEVDLREAGALADDKTPMKPFAAAWTAARPDSVDADGRERSVLGQPHDDESVVALSTEDESGDQERTSDQSKRRLKTLERGVRSSKIDELERRTPSVDRLNGEWLKNTLAAQIEGVETRTLAQYRRLGTANKDKMFGQDKDGRIWRRPGTSSSHPWYLRTTLKAQRTYKPKP